METRKTPEIKMKYPTGRECKKTECLRYESYQKWQCGDSNLNVCMKCKWAYPSQFERRQPTNTENICKQNKPQ
jgi:hypothetical protein